MPELITARNGICVKVMFSQVSVCPQVGYPPPLLTSGSHHWKPVQTCSVEDNLSPPVLTPSGSRCKVGKWQAGGIHPTGILSCFHAVPFDSVFPS